MNILKSFERHMVDIEIYRSQQLVAKTRGLLNKSKNSHRKMVNFYPKTDIQPDDTIYIPVTKATYYIVEVEPVLINGQIEMIDAYYELEAPIPKEEPSHVIYNVNNPVNSIIGNQNTATINVEEFSIEKFNQLIDMLGFNDKAELRDLSETIRQIIENEEKPQKGMLSKFSDLLAKHSWAFQVVSQMLIAWFTNN